MNHAAQSNHEEMARAYLREQLGPRAPEVLTPAGTFDEQPLEGEGRTSLFAFELTGPGGDPSCAALRHYVAVGETSPNYYPTFGLSPDDAYSLHIGTRFMLEMKVQRIEGDAPDGAEESLRRVIRDRLGGDATFGPSRLAGLFRCDESVFAVFRMTVNGTPIYSLGADLAPGFYELCQHPPQVVLRLHLGKLIRNEARFSLDGRLSSAGPES